MNRSQLGTVIAVAVGIALGVLVGRTVEITDNPWVNVAVPFVALIVLSVIYLRMRRSQTGR